MAVNPKQKAAFAAMWDDSEEANGGLSDGKYQFKIKSARFDYTKTGKPVMRRVMIVVGGSEDARGETIEVSDNLETAQNMTFFKKTLSRLNVTNVSAEDITDGTLAEQLAGKVFEGQVVNKGGFTNVYVNRLISEASGAEEAEEEAVEEKEEETPEAETKEEVEEAVEPEEVEAEAEAEAEEEGLTLPKPDVCKALPASEVKKLLGAVEIIASEVKNPRLVLVGFSALVHGLNGDFLDIPTITAVSEALGVQHKKGTILKKQIATLREAAMARVS